MTPEKLRRVLCINDSDITLFIFKRVLNKAHFSEKIVERNDGREALKYCENLIKTNVNFEDEYPRIIFLDLHMPVMNGWEFLEQFANDIWPFFKESKVVITSQSIDSGDSDRAKEFPFVIDILKVPISIEYLQELHHILLRDHRFQEP